MKPFDSKAYCEILGARSPPHDVRLKLKLTILMVILTMIKSIKQADLRTIFQVIVAAKKNLDGH